MILSSIIALQAAVLVPVPEPVGSEISATATSSDIGSTAAIFDDNPETLYRTANINPAVVTIRFKLPRESKGFRLIFLDRNEYSIEAGDSERDLDLNSGSRKEIARGVTGDDGRAEVRLVQPVKASVYRLTVKRVKGDAYVHIYDWQFVRWAAATSLRTEMTPARPEWKPSKVIPAGGVVRMRAWAGAEGSETEVTDKVMWEAKEFKPWPGAKNAFEGSRFLEGTREAAITARLGPLSAERKFTLEAFPRLNERTDVDALYIERTPRAAYDARDKGNGPGWPKTGETVVWQARVRAHNRGVTEMPYSWWVDGKEVRKGTITLAANNDAAAELPLKWTPRRQQIEFLLKAPDWDANPNNNKLKTWTDALSVGFWVEEKLWNYWLDNAQRQNPRNESFENWAQFMIELWNEMMEKAGITDRWRLDKVEIVPSGALPLSGGLSSNNPDSRDKTVDIAWGFPVEPEGKISDYWAVKPATDPYSSPPPFLADWALLHELMHARYIVDSYGFDVPASSIKVEIDGKPLIGSILPANFMRYNKYKGVMGGGIKPIIDEFAAGALERAKGRRARGGNENAPTTIGEYLSDLPTSNVMTFLLPDGRPAAGAELLIFRAKPDPANWYGKLFAGPPDEVLRLDGSGSVDVGKSPFGPPPIKHEFGYSNAVALMVIRMPSEGAQAKPTYVHFQEVSDFNLAYWKGASQRAAYTVRLVSPPGWSE